MLARQMRCLSQRAAAGYHVVIRGIQQDARIANAENNKFTPVTIDVPWGKIEAKLWGSTGKQPVLAVHGWMDNAGTFDDIVPFLTNNSSILTIDLPGHGLSSWLPRGIPYNVDIHTMALRMVVKNFGWNKVKLLGHSLGGIICYNYTRLFPEETQFVVSIDSLAFSAKTPTQHSKTRARDMDRYIELEKALVDNPSGHVEQVIIDKWIKGNSFKSLDVPQIKTLMIRGTRKKEDNTYCFTRDPLMKFHGFDSCYTLENLEEMTKVITCPYLVIKAQNTAHHNDFRYWGNVLDVLTESSSDCQVVSVKGAHHVHLMNPKLVASHISPFLKKYDV